MYQIASIAPNSLNAHTREWCKGVYSMRSGKMDEWVGVDEDLPQVDPQYTNREISVDVMFLAERKSGKGFYCYDINQWFDDRGNKVCGVLAWRSI